MWDIIAQDQDETLESFDNCLRTFIESHATTDDQHELIQQLRTPKKPRELPVHNFYYRLRELNAYVEWLPGTEPPLTDNQLKQAFYDAMPNSWRERFIGAGHSNLTMSMAELIRYFRLQENLAIKKMAENSTRQKTNASNINNNNRRRNKRGAPKEQKSKEDFKIPRKINNNKNKNKTAGKHRLEDNDPCPVHASGTHTWGECIANAFNKKRRTEYYHKNEK